MMNFILMTSAYILVLLLFLCLLRAILGPSAPDRVAAINLIGTKTVVILILIGASTKQYYFFDVALVYALISFLMTVGMAKYFEKGKLG